jgi:hypothetical protein
MFEATERRAAMLPSGSATWLMSAHPAKHNAAADTTNENLTDFVVMAASEFT